MFLVAPGISNSFTANCVFVLDQNRKVLNLMVNANENTEILLYTDILDLIFV